MQHLSIFVVYVLLPTTADFKSLNADLGSDLQSGLLPAGVVSSSKPLPLTNLLEIIPKEHNFKKKKKLETQSYHCMVAYDNKKHVNNLNSWFIHWMEHYAVIKKV